MQLTDLKWIATWGEGFEQVDPRCGYVLDNQYGIPLLIAYLMPCPNQIGVISSIAAKPGLEKVTRRKYVKSMLYYLTERAKQLGMRRVISSPTLDSLTKAFVGEGFAVFPRKADFVWKDI